MRGGKEARAEGIVPGPGNVKFVFLSLCNLDPVLNEMGISVSVPAHVVQQVHVLVDHEALPSLILAELP